MSERVYQRGDRVRHADGREAVGVVAVAHGDDLYDVVWGRLPSKKSPTGWATWESRRIAGRLLEPATEVVRKRGAHGRYERDARGRVALEEVELPRIPPEHLHRYLPGASAPVAAHVPTKGAVTGSGPPGSEWWYKERAGLRGAQDLLADVGRGLR